MPVGWLGFWVVSKILGCGRPLFLGTFREQETLQTLPGTLVPTLLTTRFEFPPPPPPSAPWCPSCAPPWVRVGPATHFADSNRYNAEAWLVCVSCHCTLCAAAEGMDGSSTSIGPVGLGWVLLAPPAPAVRACGTPVSSGLFFIAPPAGWSAVRRRYCEMSTDGDPL